MKMLAIYPIIDLAGDRSADAAFVDRVLRILRPDFLQLRMKEGSDAAIVANALLIRDRIRFLNAGTRLVINDRPDIAVRCGAPVVHVGDTDISPVEVRRRYPDLQIGLSTHSLDDIVLANRYDLAYIGFGPVFKTATKPTSRPTVFALAAEALSLSRHPVVFIGGITPDTIGDLPIREKAQAALIGSLADLLDRRAHD
ncbi:MAG TPA: thiamine phosphate synthase [bacterium]|nr:thiamine phosphate synthase [bacterium]